MVSYASAVAVGLLTWLGAYGVVDIEGIYEGNIIQTTFGYKNTGALFLSLGIILGLWLFLRESRKPVRIPIVAGSALIFITFLGTQSRAVWLLFVLQMFAVLWMFRNELASVIAYYASIIIPCLIGGPFALKYLSQQQAALSAVLVGFSIIGAVSVYWLFDRAKGQVSPVMAKAGFGILTVLLAAGFVFTVSQSGSSMARLSALSFGDGSMKERLY
ncbi:MAG: hypothetical protein ACYC21_07035, partial [Eubacteriales bacterium]